VRSSIRWLEAESFLNVLDDSGGDAFYTTPHPKTPASNGVSMTAGVGWDEPVQIRKEVALAPGGYEAWGLVRMFPEFLRSSRADIALAAGDHEVGVIGPDATDRLPFWGDPAYRWERFGELRAEGETPLTVTFRWREHAEAALADIDAVALVPVAR
jgi:hypothetical protein